MVASLPPPPSSSYELADIYMVERLTMAVNCALEQATVPGITTPAEVLSALCTSLTRFLAATQPHMPPEDRELTINEVHGILSQLLIRFGTGLN